MTANNGLVYLAHPRTGESKWLWSRHGDPMSGKDYLVNTISGERFWVTKSNEHLCPLRAPIPENALSNTPQPATDQSSSVKPSATQAQIQSSGQVHSKKPTANNTSAISATPFNATPANNSAQTQAGSNPSAASQGIGKGKLGKPGSFAKPDQYGSASGIPNRNTSGLPTPATSQMAKNFALAPGEVLMTLPGSGQQYALNTQTNTRRWLISPTPHTNPQTHQANYGHPQNNTPNAGNAYPNISPNARSLGNNIRNLHPNFHQNPHNHNLAKPGLPSHHSNVTGISGQKPENSEAMYLAGGQRMTPSSVSQGQQHPAPSEYFSSGALRNGAAVQQSATTGNTTSPANMASAKSSEAQSGQQGVSAKVATLDELLDEVERMTSGGKYDLSRLEQAVNARTGNRGANRNTITSDTAKDANVEDDVDQRLMQLAELLTQRMLKVDAVDSDGNAVVRSKRKHVVNCLLTLADKVESLRNALKALN